MPGNTLVRDVMTKNVITLSPDMSIADAADRMAEHKFGALPVVDENGMIVGLLRDEDLIVSEARVHVPTYINFLGATIALPHSMHHLHEDLQKIAGATVGEVMDEDPLTITEGATIEDLATLMHDREATHVPVVDDNRVVVGIVARGDIVRLIARET